MPLYKSIAVAENTQVHIWKITESLDMLYQSVGLKDVCLARFEGMKSEQHKKGFLSVRMLLQHIGYTDFDLYYSQDGKPHLNDGRNISITHSYGFSAIIVSDADSGIDMEMRREKVIKIADKFIDREFDYLDDADTTEYVRKLIVIWGVKESLYKMFSRNGLSFRENIYVVPFKMEKGTGTAAVHFEDIDAKCSYHFEEIEDFTLVYCTNPKG